MVWAFMPREVELPQRSSSRRQTLVALWCQPPLQGRQSSWAGFSAVLSLPNSAPQGLGLEQGGHFHQSHFSSRHPAGSVHLKAAEGLLLQLLRAGKGKTFLPAPKKTPSKSSKTKPHSAMEACLGSEASKMPPKNPKLPHFPSSAHILSLRDTATIFGLKAEDGGIDHHHKSVQDSGLSKTHQQRGQWGDLMEFLQ